MKKIIITLSIILLVLVTGCQTQCPEPNCPELDYSKCPQQKCPDLDCSTCPKQIETKTITKYQCYDGTVKDKLSDCPSKEETQKADVTVTNEEFLEIYCDSDTTTLKKETLFDENIKGNYVTWKGTVKTIKESSGDYEMGIKICDSTWTWDLDITMRSDQKDILLNLNEGDDITFKAKMVSIGDLLTDLSAKDGQVIS